MQILTPAEMKAEMEKYPDFAWPKDCVKEMMEDKELLVLEMKGLSVGVFFSKGYEIKVPLPLGCAVEIGHDGKMEKAGLEVHLPKVWAWFNARTMVMKVALMACPDIRPALHVNLEAFKMDFSVPGLSKEGINEGGWLDDIVEYVAVGFGPCTTQKEMPGWFSEKIGDLIRGQLKSMAGLGCGRPYELNMRGGGTDDAPRPSKEIREEMTRMEIDVDLLGLLEVMKSFWPNPQTIEWKWKGASTQRDDGDKNVSTPVTYVPDCPPEVKETPPDDTSGMVFSVMASSGGA